jgi:hypothetical protein
MTAGTDRRPLLLAVALFVLLRIALFPSGKSYQGDALTRVALAEAWAAHPHFIADAKEVWVIGPLQIYLDGIGVRLAGRDLGTRLPSLLAGCLLVIPLARLARRTGARHADALAVAGIAVYGLHLQSSTTAASEALFLTPLLLGVDCALSFLDEGKLRDALAAGLLLAACEAFRYDGWLYAGLVGILAARVAISRRGSWIAGTALLGVLLAAFPIFWMSANARALGDPFYTFAAHHAFHRQFAAARVAAMGPTLFRLHALFFWPAALAVTLSPGVLLVAVSGAARAVRSSWARAFAIVMGVPPLLFTLRAVVLLDFGLVARFTMATAAALAIFVGAGVERLRARGMRRRFLVVAALGAIALPVATALLAHARSDGLAEKIRTVSPLADLPPAVEHAADLLRSPSLAGPIVIDNEGGFSAMAIAFYSQRREFELIRVGAIDWERTLATARPSCAALFDEGMIGATVGSAHASQVTVGGVRLQLQRRFPAAPGGIALAIFCAPPPVLSSPP